MLVVIDRLHGPIHALTNGRRRFCPVNPLRAERSKRVLVVDDDLGIRDLLSTILEEEGYDVDTAADGLEGLEHAAATHPDVVILDFTMPRCDGPAFAARYRREPIHAPIILVTASHQVKERCRLVAADGCIGKPFDIDNLLSIVEAQSYSHDVAHAMAA